MNIEQTIAEIEWLERISSLADTRSLSASDLADANRRHDKAQISSPWFRLWQVRSTDGGTCGESS